MGTRASFSDLENRYQRLEALEQESRETAEARDLAILAHKKFTKETKEIEAELREVSRVGHDTWDTGRLSGGYPQRYVTSYLKERLVEVLADRRASVAEYRVPSPQDTSRRECERVAACSRRTTPAPQNFIRDGLPSPSAPACRCRESRKRTTCELRRPSHDASTV